MRFLFQWPFFPKNLVEFGRWTSPKGVRKSGSSENREGFFVVGVNPPSRGRCKRRWKYCKGFWQCLGCQFATFGKVWRDIFFQQNPDRKGRWWWIFEDPFSENRLLEFSSLHGMLASRSKKTRNMHHASPLFHFVLTCDGCFFVSISTTLKNQHCPYQRAVARPLIAGNPTETPSQPTETGNSWYNKSLASFCCCASYLLQFMVKITLTSTWLLELVAM